MTQRQISLTFLGVVLAICALFLGFILAHSPKPDPTRMSRVSRAARDLQVAQAFMADLYPGRRFRFLWNEGRDGWRTGFAIPLDEPRFSPIQIECPTGSNVGTFPCHLIH